MGLTTTGHAGSIHNWQVSTTHATQADLLSQMGTGILVTELMGQGVNGGQAIIHAVRQAIG